MRTRHQTWGIICVVLVGAAVVGAYQTSNAAAAAEDGWTILFDGKSTAGWRGLGRPAFPDKGWDIQDGCIHHIPRGGGGDITYDKPFENFELAFEWKVAPGANSGVKYRVQEKQGQTSALGPEYQLIDDARHPDAKASPKRVTASLYDVFPTTGGQTKPVGEFNQTRIIARGNHIEHWLNGVKVMECEYGTPQWEAAIAASKFKGNKEFARPRPGQIVFQDHGDEIWIRNIRIKAL